MTPDEIVAEINASNRELLYSRTDSGKLSPEQILALMDNAAMQGFRLGSNVALSMVKGALLVQASRSASSTSNAGARGGAAGY